MNRRNLSILFVLVIMLGSLGFLLFAKPPGKAEAPPEEPAIPVKTQVLRSDRVVLVDQRSGWFAAYARVKIHPQVGGLILEHRVEEGTGVKA